MSPRYARKVDENHEELVTVLRALGCSVEAIHGSAGTPDLLVGIFGLTELVEVKPPVGETRRRELRDTQVDWHERWKGKKPVTIRTIADAQWLVSTMRGAMTRSDVQVDPSDFERPTKRGGR